MKKIVHFVLLILIVSSCGAPPSKKEKAREQQKILINELKTFEDSLTHIESNNDTISTRYAERCLAIYRAEKTSTDAPKHLDKAHMIFASAGMHTKASAYADTLIKKYPNYKNRIMVLQSLATSYDVFILPRDKAKVKYYYELLLKENPKLPATEKASIKFRLKHIDLSFEELIKLQQKNS